jgi:hypothetical protein
VLYAFDLIELDGDDLSPTARIKSFIRCDGQWRPSPHPKRSFKDLFTIRTKYRLSFNGLETFDGGPMNWRDHMRNDPHNSTVSSENVHDFPHNDSAASRRDTINVLDLLSQAIETIRNEQYRIKESEARAKYLAERAVENLKSAEAQIWSAQSMRRAIEQELQKVSAKLTSAEAQLAQAEERGRAMEARAMDAEDAFKQLEQLIRTQLVELGRDFNKRSDLNKRSVRAA